MITVIGRTTFGRRLWLSKNHTPLCQDDVMDSLIVALLVVLIAVLAVGMFVVVNRLQHQAPVPPSVVAPTVDVAAIIEAVKATLDVNALSTGVTGAVEAKIHEATNKALSQANEIANKQAAETLSNQQKMLTANTQNLLQPFESQMRILNEEITKLREQNADKFTNVDTAVADLVRQTQTLNNVLSSSQGRGNWGERMLEDILSQSGFERGINYEKQETLIDGGRPDYSFYLPPDRVLYLDSKFPIDNYKKYFEASDENSRNMYRNAFIKNVEDRVKELEKRDYVSQSNKVALDYVLLFIPNEGILGFIQQHKPSLVDDAVSKKVVLCSPLTLYAFLGVARQATDSFHMEQNANQVLSLLTSFSKAWKSYVNNLVEIEKSFTKIQDKLRAVTVGKVMQNLRSPLNKIDDLAKARQIAGSDEVLKGITEALEEVDETSDSDNDDN